MQLKITNNLICDFDFIIIGPKFFVSPAAQKFVFCSIACFDKGASQDFVQSRTLLYILWSLFVVGSQRPIESACLQNTS